MRKGCHDDLKLRPKRFIDEGLFYTTINILEYIVLQKLRFEGIALFISRNCSNHLLDVSFVLGDLGKIVKTFID